MAINLKLQIIIEKAEQGLFGRIETKDYLPVTYGSTVEEITANMRELIDDYLENESDKADFWNQIQSSKDVEFEYAYDVQAFFDEYAVLNISKIGQLAGINPSLMRQYVSGVKHPSADQAKKIEEAIRKLGNGLVQASIV